MMMLEMYKQHQKQTEEELEKQLGSNYKKTGEVDDDDFKSQDSSENN